MTEPDLISIAEAAEHKPPPPAGWYPDPRDPSRNRYWNGSQWADPNDGLASWGYVGALFIPIVGFVIGCVLLTRNDSRGWKVIALSLLVPFLLVLAVL